MKPYLTLIPIILSLTGAVGVAQNSGGPSLNRALQSELLKMEEEDQKYRVEWQDQMIKRAASGITAQSEELVALMKKQDDIDKKNMERLEEIIKQYGWPGKSLVGKEASSAAFFILQHTDLGRQKKYFPLLKKAAKKREAQLSDAAMLEDRILMGLGKKQIYGTQLHFGPETGGKLVLYPIRDEEHVDARRAAVGLMPLAEYLKLFGLEYKPPKKK